MEHYPTHLQRIFLILILIAMHGRTQILKRAVSFSLSSRLNQTGHSVTQISVDNALHQFSDHWNLEINHNISEELGMQKIHFHSLFTVFPSLPDGYEYFPGVGYYKFHTTLANGFDDAVSKCAKEGGHLAILNSEAEHQVILTMFGRFPEFALKNPWAFIGFHDRIKEGEFLTIFGQPLTTTGFLKWSHPNLPDDYQGAEDCGSIFRSGGLNDVKCNDTLPYVCEYDLAWV